MKRILLLAFGIFILAGCNPFKVTDPSDPRFDPEKFKFSDYEREEISDVFFKIFPVGTNKEFVDAILVKSGKADMFQNTSNKNVWHYTPPKIIDGLGRSAYKVIFDDQNQLLNIQNPTTGKYIHPKQKKYKEGVLYE